jgi:hypothetical protein
MDSLFTSFVRKGYLTRKSRLMDTIMDKASEVKQNEIRLALSIDQTKALVPSPARSRVISS